MVNKSYQAYLSESVDHASKFISDATYGFERALDLCMETYKENKAEGKESLKRLSRFIIQGYLILGKGVNYSQRLELEEIIKVRELRRYIQENFIQEVLLTISKYMTKELKLV